MDTINFIQKYQDTKKLHIGKNLQNLREKLGLSEVQAAAALGISVSELVSYERGVQEIYGDMVLKFCRLLHTDMDGLVSGLENITVGEVLSFED